MHARLQSCSHCGHPNPSLTKRQGIAGRVTKTPYYQETVACKHCRLSVSAHTPGNAVAMWNRSADTAFWKLAYDKLKARMEMEN